VSKSEIDIALLAAEIGAKLSGTSGSIVTDVTHDSRQVREGTLFVAIKGATVDGHRFIDDVLRRGAVAVISEFDPPDGFEVAWLQVADARVALAKAASIINDEPSHKFDLVGVTGTNGKTTTTYLCYALAEAAGVKPAMLTTVEYRIGDRSEEAVRTTPEASDTNRFLNQAVEEGCGFAAMEASSQAIDLHRCDWLRFKVAIFTNLTRDHLDYHLTMENYYDAKKKLFDGRLGEKPGSCVINIDDEWGANLAEELRANGQRVVTFSQNIGARVSSPTVRKGSLDIGQTPPEGGTQNADLTAEDIEVSLLKGTSFLLKTPNGERRITSPLVGRPHVYNMLSAAAAVLELGYGLDSIVKGLAACVGAPGRFERVQHDGDFAVVVDYAHTDDALLNTLKTAKELAKGRIITVFGCGGDRDKTKREPMGRIAGEYSDLAIITSDNPRTEDPLKIISEIEIGVKAMGKKYLAISDRREAIRKAVTEARTNDVVIIAGKGHENYQIVGNEKFHFDDREVALEALKIREEA
jgi:UDP-N-acetylmuramoyl-L-alanyl-D-glutamate--2,6-diaminopimelate ligase